MDRHEPGTAGRSRRDPRPPRRGRQPPDRATGADSARAAANSPSALGTGPSDPRGRSRTHRNRGGRPPLDSPARVATWLVHPADGSPSTFRSPPPSDPDAATADRRSGRSRPDESIVTHRVRRDRPDPAREHAPAADPATAEARARWSTEPRSGRVRRSWPVPCGGGRRPRAFCAAVIGIATEPHDVPMPSRLSSEELPPVASECASWAGERAIVAIDRAIARRRLLGRAGLGVAILGGVVLLYGLPSSHSVRPRSHGVADPRDAAWPFASDIPIRRPDVVQFADPFRRTLGRGRRGPVRCTTDPAERLKQTAGAGWRTRRSC